MGNLSSITLQKPRGQLSELFTSPWSSNIFPKGSPRTLRSYFGFKAKDLPQDLVEHTQSLRDPGDETMRQAPSLESIFQCTLVAVQKATIRMGKHGLGLIVIQNGPYLQIISIVEKSSAAKDGKLKPERIRGRKIYMFDEIKTRDVLIKIGHATILGWTLQQLWQLLQNIPIGTTLQIRFYRNFVEVPQDWQITVETRSRRVFLDIPLPAYTASRSLADRNASEIKRPCQFVIAKDLDNCNTDYDEDGIESSTDDDAGL